MSFASGAGPNGSPRAIAREGALALVLAVVVNTVVTAVARLLGVGEGLDPLTYPPVIMLTAAGVIGATVVYGALVGLTGKPDRNFTVIAAIVLVLSVIPDVAFIPARPGGTIVAGVVLATLHVLSAGIVVWRLVGLRGLRRTVGA